MLVALPIVLPFLSVLLLILGKGEYYRKTVALSATLLLLAASILLLVKTLNAGIQVQYAGSWNAPFGISLVADTLSAVMVFITALIAFCITVYSFKAMQKEQHHLNFYLFFMGMIMGMNGIFLTGDIFNMYVWFEVTLMASFVLMVLGNRRKQLEGGLKYLIINLIGSLIFLGGVGLLYAHAGTLNLADLSQRLRASEFPRELDAALAMIFIAFLIKSPVLPFFFWLPASYHTPPITVAAFFSGLLTKIGIYALLRVSTLLFSQFNPFWNNIFLLLGGLTMVTGVLGALAQDDFRRLLSFHIISQLGYMVMGIGFFTPLSIAATIYFVLHIILTKTNLFILAGIIGKTDGTYRLDKLHSWYKRSPGVAVMFFISAMALAGIPPLSGFFGKYLLARGGFETDHFLVAAVSLLTGIVTLISMLKVWIKVFWSEREGETGEPRKPSFSTMLPAVILTVLIVALGAGAGWVFDLLEQAAGQLLGPGEYIRNVLQNGNAL